MIKRSLLLTFTIAVAISFSVLGGVYYNYLSQKQKIEPISLQNHIGDLRFQSKDFFEIPSLQQHDTVTKNGEEGTAALVSSVHTSGNEAKTNVQKPTTRGIDPLCGQIEQKYISRLQTVATSYEAKLNGLFSTALNEYNTTRKANADITPLVNKYYSAGKALEAECDAQFYSILAAFESELKANSFPLDAAVKAKETYEARKSFRSGQLIPTGKQ